MQANPELAAPPQGFPADVASASDPAWRPGSGPSIRAVLALSFGGIALAATLALAAFVTRYAP